MTVKFTNLAPISSSHFSVFELIEGEINMLNQQHGSRLYKGESFSLNVFLHSLPTGETRNINLLDVNYQKPRNFVT